METVVFDVSVALLAFLSMEAVAWFTHRYVMHGFLWILHKDHHRKAGGGFFEHNDLFFLIFALPGIAFLVMGAFMRSATALCIGTGITLYGSCYFLVHDIFIHQRFKVFRNSQNRYLNALRRAHKVHHKHLDKPNGECFGMLWVPLKYYIPLKKK